MEYKNIWNSRYSIQYEFSKGSFGIVYKGTDLVTQTTVAIKQVTCNTNELKTLLHINKNLKDNNKYYENYVCVLIDWYTNNNCYFLVFNFFNYNLLYTISNFSNFKNETIFEIFKNICMGICFLHKLNLVHTDLKPENILISFTSYNYIKKKTKLNNITLKICDFGSAEYENTIINYPITSLYYRAPEILKNNINNKSFKISKSMDMWSLGCILYELMYNKVAFEFNYENKETYIDMLKFINKYIFEHRKKKLENLSSILDRLLVHQEKRYNSAKIINILPIISISDK